MGKNQNSNQKGTITRQAAYEITSSVYSASKKVGDKIPWVDFTQVGLAQVGLAQVDSTQVGSTQVGSTQIGLAQVS